jgi:tellurite methyltransferase
MLTAIEIPKKCHECRMKQDRIKWNEKYRKESFPTEVASVVKNFYHLAPGKKALDIAAGNGRNAVFLSQKGFSVDAVDISEVGFIEFTSRFPNINAICADLDQFEIATGHYDLILNVKFLNRRLFPYIQEGLKPGGVVIFHTLLGSKSDKRTPEHCRDYLLRTNELLHAFLAMRIIYYREAEDPEMKNLDEMATLVAVKQ